MILAITNQKGGVGKTTTAVNLSVCLANEHGKRTLLIDLDAQGHAGAALGVEITDSISTAFEVITGKSEPLPYHLGERLHIWPGARDMDDLDALYGTKAIGHHLLKEALAKVSGQYDAVIIDTPPHLHLPTLNALTAASHYLVPIAPGFLSVDGMAQLLLEITDVRKYANPALEMVGVVLQQADSRTLLPADTLAMVREAFGDVRILQTVIPDTIALAEAPGFGQSIFEYQPQSRAAQAYRDLTKEVLEIVETTNATGRVS